MSQGTAVVVGVGAETGLGAGLARRFAREGLRVVVAGRTEQRLHVATASIRSAGGSVVVKVADASREADVIALFDEAAGENDLELVVYMLATTSLRLLSKRRQNFSKICGGRTPWEDFWWASKPSAD